MTCKDCPRCDRCGKQYEHVCRIEGKEEAIGMDFNLCIPCIRYLSRTKKPFRMEHWPADFEFQATCGGNCKNCH